MIYRVQIKKDEWIVVAMTQLHDQEHNYMCNVVHESPDGSSHYYYIRINIGKFYPDHFAASALSSGLRRYKEQQQCEKTLWRDELGKVAV